MTGGGGGCIFRTALPANPKEGVSVSGGDRLTVGTLTIEAGATLKQFNSAAFRRPAVGSVGLDSGSGCLRGWLTSVFDLAIARNIRPGGNRNLQLRAEMFNAPNAAIITNRNTTLISTARPIR